MFYVQATPYNPTAFGLFVISSPRRCLCCLWSVQQGSSRAVLQFHIGFFVLSAFYSVAVTWPGYRVLKKTRGNVTRFGHIASRQKVFFLTETSIRQTSINLDYALCSYARFTDRFFSAL